jgi:amino acid transporter
MRGDLVTAAGSPAGTTDDDAQLAALGYSGEFERSMGLWANMALGFTYLSPLVGVYSLFAYSLSIGGPPSLWWIVIVGVGQLLVSLVFGEVVSQYPLAGGIYPWTRRLWNRRVAWIVSWIYIWAIIVTVTAVAEFGGGFVAALFGIDATPGVGFLTAAALLLIAFAFNYSGTRTLARIARIGLAAELIGVIALGLYLLLFQREQSF